MKETTITIRTYNRECQAEQEHPVTAYADDRLSQHGLHALAALDFGVPSLTEPSCGWRTSGQSPNTSCRRSAP